MVTWEYFIFIFSIFTCHGTWDLGGELGGEPGGENGWHLRRWHDLDTQCPHLEATQVKFDPSTPIQCHLPVHLRLILHHLFKDVHRVHRDHSDSRAVDVNITPATTSASVILLNVPQIFLTHSSKKPLVRPPKLSYIRTIIVFGPSCSSFSPRLIVSMMMPLLFEPMILKSMLSINVFALETTVRTESYISISTWLDTRKPHRTTHNTNHS